MKREWSFHRSSNNKKRVIFLVLAGLALFVLGFFAARPILLLFGLAS